MVRACNELNRIVNGIDHSSSPDLYSGSFINNIEINK